MNDWAIYLLLGVTTGTLGGVFGIGGGLLAIPALVLVFDMSQQLAQGTALVMVVPNVLLSLWRYHQRNPIALRDALPLALSGLVFAGLGSMIAVGLDGAAMRIGFAVFLLLLAAWNYARMFLRKPMADAQLRCSWFGWAVLGAGSGGLGGFFGVGGSVLATAALTCAYGTTQVVAQGLSLALAVPSTTATLLTYAAHEHVDWHVGLPMAVGGLLSIGLGVKWAHALPDRQLRGGFCLLLVGCAVSLMLKG